MVDFTTTTTVEVVVPDDGPMMGDDVIGGPQKSVWRVARSLCLLPHDSQLVADPVTPQEHARDKIFPSYIQYSKLCKHNVMDKRIGATVTIQTVWG